MAGGGGCRLPLHWQDDVCRPRTTAPSRQPAVRRGRLQQRLELADGARPEQRGHSQTDLTVGTGTEATAGKTATVQYGGWLYSETAADHKGAQFDASQFSFLVGGGTIIKGFDMGERACRWAASAA